MSESEGDTLEEKVVGAVAPSRAKLEQTVAFGAHKPLKEGRTTEKRGVWAWKRSQKPWKRDVSS